MELPSTAPEQKAEPALRENTTEKFSPNAIEQGLRKYAERLKECGRLLNKLLANPSNTKEENNYYRTLFQQAKTNYQNLCKRCQIGIQEFVEILIKQNGIPQLTTALQEWEEKEKELIQQREATENTSGTPQNEETDAANNHRQSNETREDMEEKPKYLFITEDKHVIFISRGTETENDPTGYRLYMDGKKVQVTNVDPVSDGSCFIETATHYLFAPAWEWQKPIWRKNGYSSPEDEKGLHRLNIDHYAINHSESEVHIKRIPEDDSANQETSDPDSDLRKETGFWKIDPSRETRKLNGVGTDQIPVGKKYEESILLSLGQKSMPRLTVHFKNNTDFEIEEVRMCILNRNVRVESTSTYDYLPRTAPTWTPIQVPPNVQKLLDSYKGKWG